jgi:hypothetical protein
MGCARAMLGSSLPRLCGAGSDLDVGRFVCMDKRLAKAASDLGFTVHSK